MYITALRAYTNQRRCVCRKCKYSEDKDRLRIMRWALVFVGSYRLSCLLNKDPSLFET